MKRIPDVFEAEQVEIPASLLPFFLNDEIPSSAEGERLPDLLVIGRGRWDDGDPRTQRLFTRFARDRRVFYVEEPIDTDDEETCFAVSERTLGVQVVAPRLPRRCRGLTDLGRDAEFAAELLKFVHRKGIVLDPFTLWFESPRSIRTSRMLEPTVVVYDCVKDVGGDESLRDLEWELLERADLVFTDSYATALAKMYLNPAVEVMPNPTKSPEDSRAWGELQARMARAERETRERKLREMRSAARPDARLYA